MQGCGGAGVGAELLNFGPTWNAIGLYQVVISILWLRDIVSILLDKKSFDRNSQGYALLFPPALCCFVAWVLGYWYPEDAGFWSYYFLTLPAAAFFVATFVLVHSYLPHVEVAITVLAKLQTYVLIRRASFFFFYYAVAVLLFWVSFKFGFFINSRPCASFSCQAGQFILGSKDKIFASLTVVALIIQIPLGASVIILYAFLFKQTKI